MKYLSPYYPAFQSYFTYYILHIIAFPSYFVEKDLKEDLKTILHLIIKDLEERLTNPEMRGII